MSVKNMVSYEPTQTSLLNFVDNMKKSLSSYINELADLVGDPFVALRDRSLCDALKAKLS